MCWTALGLGWIKSISGTSVLGSVFDLRVMGVCVREQSELGMGKNFRHRVLQRGVSLLTENRDDEGSASTAG